MTDLCKMGSLYIITDISCKREKKQSKKPWVDNFIAKARNMSALEFFLYIGAYSNQSSIYLKNILK